MVELTHYLAVRCNRFAPGQINGRLERVTCVWRVAGTEACLFGKTLVAVGDILDDEIPCNESRRRKQRQKVQKVSH